MGDDDESPRHQLWLRADTYCHCFHRLQGGGEYRALRNMKSTGYTARAASVFLPFGTLLRLSGVGPVIVVYHTVSDQALPHVSPLYRHKTPREFETDLDLLLRHMPALEIDEVISAAHGGKCRRGFFLTFDDGLRQVADEAAPILRRKGLPAALFINPPFLDNRELFYRFKTALILSRIGTGKATANEEAQRILGEPDASPATLTKAVLTMTYCERSLLDTLADVYEVDFSTYLKQQRPYLTREQVAGLQRQGWALGAHSMDHPHFEDIPLTEQLRQTRDSLDAIDEMFAPAHRLFAFPFNSNGVEDAYYSAARDTLKIAALFGTGGWYHEPGRRLLHRVLLEGEKPPAHVYLRVSLGYAWLKHLAALKSDPALSGNAVTSRV